MSLLGVEGQSLAKEPVAAGHVCVLAGQGAMSCPFTEPKPPSQGSLAAKGDLPLLSASCALAGSAGSRTPAIPSELPASSETAVLGSLSFLPSTDQI